VTVSSPADRHVSPWLDTMPRPVLGATGYRNTEPEVVVIGAGITGATTALLLQREGRRVAVLDAEPLGSRSVTTRSTVKATYGHGTLCSTIAQERSLEAARAYAQANVAGLEQILDLARELDIDCTLEHGHPHVVYAESEEDAQRVEAEAAVAERLGLPVTLRAEAPVPFAVAAALHFEEQAQFHPGRYLAGLAEAFVREGGTVIEGVRATDVDEHGDGCTVQTTEGQLSASFVVIATQYPFLDRGGHFSQLKAHRSYGIAGVLPEGTPAGMTINAGSPTRSTRTADLGGERLLVVVGEGHEVGHVTETSQRWVALQEWARERFGVTEFRYHWSAEETSALDHVPFAGFIAPGSRRVLTATGFDGWGMTNGTASAMLIRDLVLERDNPWAPVFDARRAGASLPGRDFIAHNAHVAKTWLKDRVGGSPAGSVEDLRPGQAAVMEVDGEQTAAYRDEQGTVHAVSAVCTHMKCTVAWNQGERSWDCPCHGSRFSCAGDVLHGPATTPLSPRDLG
jgi:glycine/D-amino acid oxidase-like deaminating enzyme/nitrite reductase/ring-hydroxylating ferredoxin subunit